MAGAGLAVAAVLALAAIPALLVAIPALAAVRALAAIPALLVAGGRSGGLVVSPP